MTHTNTKIAERIAKILNQAENAATEGEASVFMQKAQEMATRYSIDLAKARHMTVAKERTVPMQRTVELGERKTRGLNTYVELITGIARANDLKLTIRHDSTGVHLFGFEEDIDVTEALFASLLTQMVTATAAFKKAGTWKSDKVYKSGHYEYQRRNGKWTKSYSYSTHGYHPETRWVDAEYVPVSWLSARLDFQNAFAARVGSRLQMAKFDAQQAVQAQEEASESAGTELVLVEKAVAVKDYFDANNNARGTYRGGRSRVASHTSASAGRAAGDRARLSGSASIGGSRGAISA